MTIGGWFLFAFIALGIIAVAAWLFVADLGSGDGTKVAILITAAVLIMVTFGVMNWYYHSTASGQRAFKTQESNLGGGIERTVTVYSYNGEEIESWSGKFDVTENDQETYFDIDGRRVIIQGGIIINEEDPK